MLNDALTQAFSFFNLNPAYIKLLIRSIKMSSEESSDDRSAITQEPSDSDSEAETLPHIQSKSKCTDTAFGGWKFTDTIQADVEEGELEFQ